MSLIGTLTTGVSGLITNSRAMNIIGDNISNVNTTAFKSSRAVFGDQFSTSLIGGTLTSQVGKGTQILGSLQSFAQGAFENSTSALDLAVDGNGFFVVNDGTGNFYTRAGQFSVNANGLVQTITGEILQGFEITNNVVGTTLTDVSLTGVQSQPQATTAFTLSAQLDGSEAAGFTFNSPIQVFNSVGSQDILNVQFTKVATLGNDWEVRFTSSIGQSVVVNSPIPVIGSLPLRLSFDTSGQLTDILDDADNSLGLQDVTMTIDYTPGNPPAADLPVTWTLTDATGLASNGSMTAFATGSSNNSVIQDGFGSGILTGVAVDFDGTVAGLFDNG
ncbi:MAG: flagellar hook-basal body complex protein, partial [Nitrospinaceae bacterium]